MVVGFQRGVELQAVVYGASVLCYGVKIGAEGVIDYEDVVHVSCIKCYVFESRRNFTWNCSKCCKNISAVMTEMGDPMATPLVGQ